MSAENNLQMDVAGQERATANGEVTPVLPGRESGLNLAIIYEDEATQEWAREVCERVSRLVGRGAIRCTWWSLGGLSEPAVLAGAVSTALRADVLIVAVRAAEGFPLPFYVWVDSWLPHRGQTSGALVALVGFSESVTPRMDRAREYLQQVARLGRMDFLFEERRLPTESPGESPEIARLPQSKAARARRFAEVA